MIGFSNMEIVDKEVDYLEMNSPNEVGCLELICIYFQRGRI